MLSLVPGQLHAVVKGHICTYVRVVVDAFWVCRTDGTENEKPRDLLQK